MNSWKLWREFEYRLQADRSASLRTRHMPGTSLVFLRSHAAPKAGMARRDSKMGNARKSVKSNLRIFKLTRM